MHRQTRRHTRPTVLLLLRLFIAAETFTKPLSSNDKGDTDTHAVEMGCGAMVYVPGFIKIVSGIRKLLGGLVFTDSMEMA
jgi:hypothetical protein